MREHLFTPIKSHIRGAYKTDWLHGFRHLNTMKVSFASALALAACLVGVDAALPLKKDSIIIFTHDGDSFKINYQDHTDEYCKKPGDNISKAIGPYICLDQSTAQFTESSHFENIKFTANPQSLELLVRYASGWLDTRGNRPAYGNPALDYEMLKSVGGYLSAVVESPLFGYFIDGLTDDVIKNNMVKLLTKVATTEPVLKKLLERASVTDFTDHAKAIITKIKTTNILPDLASEKQQALLADNSLCKEWTGNDVARFTSTVWENVNGSCLDGLKDQLAAVANHLDIGVRKIPTTSLEHGPVLPHQMFGLLTADQIEAYGSKENCDKLPLDQVDLRGNAQKMKHECFASALAKKRALPTANFENGGAASFPKDILKSVADASDSYQYLKNVLPHLSEEQKQPLFDQHENCGSIPDTALDRHNRVNVSDECFKNLGDKLKVYALIYANVSENVLADQESDAMINMAKAWTSPKPHFLQSAQFNPKIASIIANMGSGVTTDDHPCRAFKSHSDFVKLPVVQRFMSKECYDKLGYTPTLNQLAELDPNVRKHADFTQILADATTQQIKDLNAKGFGILADATKLCEEMEIDRFASLSSSVKKEFPPKCLAELKCFHEVKAFSDVAPKAFELITAERIATAQDKAINDAQRGMAGSALADKSQHPATAYDANAIGAMTSSQAKAMHKSFWNALPAAAYAGFKKDIFTGLPPDNTVGMVHEQLVNVPPEVKSKITVGLAKKLGFEAKDTVPHPLTSFKDLEGLDSAVAQTVKSRLTTESKGEAAAAA